MKTPAAGATRPHESAVAQVTGGVRYIDDLPEVKGTLYAAPILSPIAHGRINQIDATVALAEPGVVQVITAKDIRGGKYLASYVGDEPIFALDEVLHVGQVIGLVIARSVTEARHAARKVRLDITPLKAILSVDEAIKAQHFVLPTVKVSRGRPAAKIKTAAHQLSGRFSIGGQEHFYLEGQIAYALPQEQGQWLVLSSTQHPGEVQHWIAHALGTELNSVRVECRRMGGGFGGKETQAGQMAVWAAIAAQVLDRPVKMRLDRDDDFMITGKRHPFTYEYQVGFNKEGAIEGLVITMAVDCGFSADLSGPVADRAIFHCDNAYFLEDLEVVSYRCKTHLQSSTAFRGFGGPQGMIVIETIIGEIGRHLGQDPLDIRRRNLYGGPGRDLTHYGMTVEDNIVPQLFDRLEGLCSYKDRRQEIKAWNSQQQVLKRGMALTPVKFGISFTATHYNQAGALVHVYTDGSVLINHGGTEMGQGLHTKICQIVADVFGLPASRMVISASDTSKVANASATAASSGTDLNGKAAEAAALQIRERLAQMIADQDGVNSSDVRFADGQVISMGKTPVHRSFEEVVRSAYMARIQLWSDGFYKTPKIHYDKKTLQGRPFFYFSYGVACTEVVIDTLTGESRVLRVDILHDVGRSINPGIDIGQIEGGFIQGMGWLTTEELVWNEAGRLTTHAPSTYKIPATGDTPPAFHVHLWTEPNQEDSIFRSKAVGEPPFMLAISVWEAIRDAVSQARESQQRPAAVSMDGPATAERILFAVHDA